LAVTDKVERRFTNLTEAGPSKVVLPT